jgi:hypothetical protein
MSAGHSGRTTDFNFPYMNDGDYASGDDFQREVQGIENQVKLLVDAWGAGVLGDTSWAVTAGTGLTVSVAAGRGIVDIFAGETDAATIVTIPDNATRYIWAMPSEGDELDQAWILEPEFVAQVAATGYAGTLLAEVVSLAGVLTITDRRSFIGREDLQNQIDDADDAITHIQAALGTAYDDYVTGSPGTVDDRLDALEGGGLGGDATYWGTLERSASDDETIDEAIAAAIDDVNGNYSHGLLVNDQDALISGFLLELLREVGLHGQAAVADQRSVYVFHPNTSPRSMYDYANSTAHPDRLEGTIH